MPWGCLDRLEQRSSPPSSCVVDYPGVQNEAKTRDMRGNVLTDSFAACNIAPTCMSTTTVTGTERRPSMRQPEWQPPKTSTSQPMASPTDKFPEFKDEAYDTVPQSGEPHPSPVRSAPNDLWEPRKTGPLSRGHMNGSIRNPKHRPRKSISDAISTIRTRNASVSANASELADALRVPLSYRLIVG